MPEYAQIKGKAGEHKILRFYTIDDYSCYLLEEEHTIHNNHKPGTHTVKHQFWHPEHQLILRDET